MVKVLIRTEGHVKLGMGNIYRSIRIAKKIKQLYNNTEIQFIAEPTSVIGLKKILDAGLKVDLVDFSNINQYIRYIKNYNPDIVINDILNLEEDYMRELKKLRLLIVNFEDKQYSVTRNYADIVFNSLYEDKEAGENYYYGPKYAPIKEEFRSIEERKINKECKNFLLTFGGSDPSGFTLKVSNILSKIPNIKITIFLGPTFSNREPLKDLLKNLDKDRFIIKYDVEYDPEYFKDADIALASGGNTVYELSACGVPIILLCQNDLETERGKVFSKFGNLINMGDGNKINNEDLLKIVKKLMKNYGLRKKMSEKGQELVDGNGLDRIVDIIFNEFKNNK
jgi:spore coat polysaccharide biosynthesis predicted glycosyltransferase SpsG